MHPKKQNKKIIFTDKTAAFLARKNKNLTIAKPLRKQGKPIYFLQLRELRLYSQAEM
jgi:hypothetical protein